jgi:hypothetical protein
MVSLGHCRQIPGHDLKLRHDRSLSHHIQFIIHHSSTIRRYIVQATADPIKWATTPPPFWIGICCLQAIKIIFHPSNILFLLSYVLQLRRSVAGFQPRRPGFDLKSGHVAFEVEKVALGQVFYEYFGFHCQFSFHRLLNTQHHHLSCGAGTMGRISVDVRSCLTTPQGER